MNTFESVLIPVNPIRQNPMSAAQSATPARFEGTDTYVATDDLKLAVNAALTLQRPLLIKSEPGTGKTMLAEEVARALGRPLLQWHVKSTTKAHQGLYEVRRGVAPARLAARRRRSATSATTSCRARCGRPSKRRSPWWC